MPFGITMVSKNGEEVRFPCELDQTVSEAAEAAGYRVISCASGYCGACAAVIVSGRCSLPTATGAEEAAGEGDDVLLCRCSPRTDLIVSPRFGWMKIRRETPIGEV